MSKKSSGNSTAVWGLAVLCTFALCGEAALAQDAVFSKLRQLPDLGACTNPPDPDLNKALKNAVAQAQAQAQAMLDSVLRMKEAGLAAPDALKQLAESANTLSQVLSQKDPCQAARAFAQLSPAASAPTSDVVAQNAWPSLGKKVTLRVKDSDIRDAAVPAPLAFDGITASKRDDLDPPAKNTALQGDQKPLTLKVPREKISVSTDVLDFGHQSLQTASEAKPVTITNNSDNSDKKPLVVQLLASTIVPRNFKVSGCQNAIEQTKQCTFNVTFSPFQVKPRERYLAVVAKDDAEVFEKLSDELTKKQSIADRLEDKWRKAKRCEDHGGRDCPTKDQGNQASCQDKTPEEVLQEKVCPSGILYRKTQDARDIAANAELNLRAQFNVITLNASGDYWKFPFTRGVVGVDMSAPSSRTVKQSYFVDFDLLAPLRPFPFVKKNEDPLENRLWLWLNPRITSLPQATKFSAVSNIDQTASFFQSVSGGHLNDIANGFDVNGGLEVAIVKPRDGIPWWGEYANTQARLATSWIIGGGVSTPFSTDSTEVQSAVTQAICDAFKSPVSGQKFSDQNGLVCQFNGTNTAPSIIEGPTTNPNGGLRNFIDFYTPDRSRFFRRYYTGLRFKTYYFSRDVHSYCEPFENRAANQGDCDAPYDIFPGIIDVTVGQDEAVTKGHLSGWLFRLEAVYPLPWYQGIHIFGSVYTKLQKNRIDQPYSPYTIQAPPSGGATDLNTFRFGLHPLDRDYFRIGVGVDIIQAFKKKGQPDKNAPKDPASTDKTGKN